MFLRHRILPFSRQSLREGEEGREGKSYTMRLSEGWRKRRGRKRDRKKTGGIKNDLTFYNFPVEFPL